MPEPKSDETLTAMIQKLQGLTASGKLVWSSDDRLLRVRENVIGHVYTADFAGSRFALHEFEYAHYYDEDQWQMIPSVRLELIDHDGRLLYDFKLDQNMGQVRELLDAVRRESAGVDDLVKRLLEVDEN